MPWATVRAFSSPVMMLMARDSGVAADRMESAALGPTPDTEVRSWKQLSSFSVEKPNSSMASSRTFRWV